PNTVLDNLGALGESDLKVYLAAVRAVLGYPRQRLSLAYLVRVTGLTKGTVRKALGDLRQRGLLNEDYTPRLEPVSSAQIVPRKPAKNGDKRKRTPPPPAVQAFREITMTYPKKSLWGDIAATVDDLDRWRRIVKRWVALGWNPLNVAGMLDCYRKGEIPGPKRNGRKEPAWKPVERY
ncbi:hypothetical protein D6833_10980, partial [Candidatus Parcubacteria bacterium]